MSIKSGAKPTLKPFIKWAGGKRWFVRKHADLFPDEYNCYIEPFLGGGAVFFHLQPKNAILGDLSNDLIETYQAIKDDWNLVYRYLKGHHNNHSKDYYYKVRRSSLTSPASKAAKFIYLNRTCWNGLYRVNLKGQFNVPIGTSDSVVFQDDNFEEISSLLQNTNLYTTDFEDLLDKATNGDLVFIDPPYTVRHNYNAFVQYNEKLFSWQDQERLFYAVKRAQNRGAHVIGTNAYHSSVRKLYRPSFKTKKTSRSSTISSKAETRSNYEELIIFTEK